MPRTHVPLSSSFLRSASYDPDTRTLDIGMDTGQTYTFENVPQDIFEGLRDAGSPGNFYHQNIKGRF
jgi:hypothetical protein